MTDTPEYDAPSDAADLAAPPPAWTTPEPPASVEVAPPAAPPGPGAFRTATTTLAYGLLIVAAWCALQLWGLGKAPFHTKGEPREALVVWEMTHGGGWILPKRNGTEVPSKPPLFHWLGAVTALAHGAADEWSVRFPSAALSLLALLGVFAAGTALWTPHAGCASALALMTTFEWARAATNARVDMVLTFGLEAALLGLLFFLRSQAAVWLVPVYGGITLAVLGKGPVGAALPVLVALVVFALTRDVSPVRRLRLGTGSLAVLVGAGTWYVLAAFAGGSEFVQKQIIQENLLRVVGGAEFAGGHRHPPTYLLGALLLGLLPWTLCLPAVAMRLWRDRGGLTAGDPRVFLLAWIVVVFAVYTVATSKRGVYLLGLYPAVALLLGWWWDERTRSPGGEDRWLADLVRGLSLLVAALVGVGLVAAVLDSLHVPLLATAARWLPLKVQESVPLISAALHAEPGVLWGALAGAIGALYGTAWAARGRRWAGIVVGLFLAAAAAIVAARQALLPAFARQVSPYAWMAEVREAVDPAAGLSFYKAFDYGAVYYWRGHIARYHGAWPDGAPQFVLTPEREWARMPQEVRAQYERVRLAAEDAYRAPKRLVLLRRVVAAPAAVP